MEFEAIRYEKTDGVATITKNNSPQYGMTLAVLTEMRAALIDANNDADVCVVVITAGGEGFHMGAVVFGEARSDWAVHVGLAIGGVPAVGAVGLPGQLLLLLLFLFLLLF